MDTAAPLPVSLAPDAHILAAIYVYTLWYFVSRVMTGHAKRFHVRSSRWFQLLYVSIGIALEDTASCLVNWLHAVVVPLLGAILLRFGVTA